MDCISLTPSPLKYSDKAKMSIVEEKIFKHALLSVSLYYDSSAKTLKYYTYKLIHRRNYGVCLTQMLKKLPMHF